MNESVFKGILCDVLECGLTEYNNAPEHKFSLKHKLAMKLIFAKFTRNVRKLKKEGKLKDTSIVKFTPRLSIRQRVIIAVIIVILMSLLVGWVVVFVSENFHGTVYQNYTLLFAIDTENCPTAIEIKYSLTSVPDGFEMIETDSSPVEAYTLYSATATGQTITLRQWVKTAFDPHYNTEHHHFEEITVNGKTGLYIDFSNETNCRTLLVWDNEDYILEIVADLTKSETLNLVGFNKF